MHAGSSPCIGVSGILHFISLFLRFDSLPFFPRLTKEEDKMRRKNENGAFKEAPPKISSLTYSTLENPLRKQRNRMAQENGDVSSRWELLGGIEARISIFAS